MFEHPHCAGAYANNPSALCPGMVNLARCFRCDYSILFMYHMLRRVFHLYRPERIQRQMSSDEDKPYTFFLQACHQLVGKMQPRCGSRHAALLLGVYRVVSLWII